MAYSANSSNCGQKASAPGFLLLRHLKIGMVLVLAKLSLLLRSWGIFGVSFRKHATIIVTGLISMPACLLLHLLSNSAELIDRCGQLLNLATAGKAILVVVIAGLISLGGSITDLMNGLLLGGIEVVIIRVRHPAAFTG